MNVYPLELGFCYCMSSRLILVFFTFIWPPLVDACLQSFFLSWDHASLCFTFSFRQMRFVTRYFASFLTWPLVVTTDQKVVSTQIYPFLISIVILHQISECKGIIFSDSVRQVYNTGSRYSFSVSPKTGFWTGSLIGFHWFWKNKSLSDKYFYGRCVIQMDTSHDFCLWRNLQFRDGL